MLFLPSPLAGRFFSQSRFAYYFLAHIIETIKPHAVTGGYKPGQPLWSLQQNCWTETSVGRKRIASKTLLISARAQCPSGSLSVSQTAQRENDFQQQSGHKPTEPGFHNYSITVSILVFFLFPLIKVRADFG